MSSDPYFQLVANGFPDAFEDLCGVLDLPQRNIAYRMQGPKWIDLACGVPFLQKLHRYIAGFLKLVHKKDGTLLGITIVAGRAGEMIHEWLVAMEHGLKVGDLARVIHVYPTYSTASMQVAADIRVTQLLGGMSGKVIRRIAHLMR